MSDPRHTDDAEACALQSRLCNLINGPIDSWEAYEAEYEDIDWRFGLTNGSRHRLRFWDSNVLIPAGRKLTSRHAQRHETIASLWVALGLSELGRTTGDASQLSLGSFVVSRFPIGLQDLCAHYLGPLTRISFECAYWSDSGSQPSAVYTVEHMWLVRYRAFYRIEEMERLKATLLEKSAAITPLLRNVLCGALEIRVDSDDGMEHADGNTERDHRADNWHVLTRRHRTRRVFYSEMSRSTDTHVEKIDMTSIVLKPSRGVANMRLREQHRVPFIQLFELMGAMDSHDAFDERLPQPQAPVFSYGAALGDDMSVIAPNHEVNRDTVVTQKMIDMDKANGSRLVADYEEVHQLAKSLRCKLLSLYEYLKGHCTLLVRIENDGVLCKTVRISELTQMQKFAIGQLYVHAVSTRANDN